jgi:hypothetical protein
MRPLLAGDGENAMRPWIPRIAVPAIAAAFLGHGADSAAGVIIGGSTLLNGAYVTELETWLGEGPLALTNIYTKAPGDTSLDFHAAVDGMGPTFVVMQATEADGTGDTAIIGGYDPQSWDNTANYHVTFADSSRNAFLFNLTTSALYPQVTSAGWCPVCGQYQTYDDGYYGPIFGGGQDIYVDTSLAHGYSFLWSYATNATTAFHSIIDLSPYDGGDVVYGAIEVFTLAPMAIPEPATLALLGLGIAGVGYARSRGVGRRL